MNKIAYLLLACACALSLSSVVYGRVVRVIHINDLHSQMDHAGFATRGGYAALKRTIDQAKAEAKAQGVEVLTLDGGDFGEGGAHYLGREGLDSYEVINHLGLDAAVIGNHDWLMGQANLNRILPQVGFTYQLLGANFLQKTKREFLKQYIKPYAIFERAGLRIAVIGLTTDEFFYSWRVEDNPEDKIEDPVQVFQNFMPEMRRKADFVIALTHIGTKADIKLAKKTKGLDFIVGAHSHTCLYQAVNVENPEGQVVPIVQTGNHAENIGISTLELEPGKPALLLDYKLVPVIRSEGEDSEMLARVDEIEKHVAEKYGDSFYHEKIATASVDLDPPNEEPTLWGKIFAEAIRTSADAEVAFDVPMFHGRKVPAGDVTMEDLFQLYPRVFDFKDKYGWNVWTAKVQGWVLDAAIRLLATAGISAVVGGVKVKTILKLGKVKVQSITINGLPVNPIKNYKVAFGEGIVRASAELTPLFQAILQSPKNTKKPIWLELKRYIQDRLKGRIDAPARSALANENPVTFFFPHRLPPAPAGDIKSQQAVRAAALAKRPDPETTCYLWNGETYYGRDAFSATTAP